jgi:hypothetical protein
MKRRPYYWIEVHISNERQGGSTMDIRALMLQMVSLHKASFDNGFAALATIQDEAERITSDYMDQAGWITSVGKGMLKEWFSLVRKGRNDFKKAIDDGYTQVGGYINTSIQKTLGL